MNQPMIKIDGVEITAELRRLREENEDHIQQLRKEQLEVERLHRVNAQLLEALDYFMQCVEQSAHLDARIGFMGGAFDKARAAIAAAERQPLTEAQRQQRDGINSPNRGSLGGAHD